MKQNGPVGKKKQSEASQSKDAKIDANNKTASHGSVLSDLDKAHLQRWLSMQKTNVSIKSTLPQRCGVGVSQQIAVVKPHILSQGNQQEGEQEEKVKGQKIINRVNSNKTHGGESLIKTFTNMVPKIEGKGS